MELVLVQILVEVAIIHLNFVKTDSEKVSMSTAIEHGLIEF